MIGLARLAPGVRVLALVGRHSLILMGMNGFFFWFVNRDLANAMALSSSPGTVLFGCTAVTVVSLAVCMPVVWLLDRYLPQLVGRPRVRGPLLPPLA